LSAFTIDNAGPVFLHGGTNHKTGHFILLNIHTPLPPPDYYFSIEQVFVSTVFVSLLYLYLDILQLLQTSRASTYYKQRPCQPVKHTKEQQIFQPGIIHIKHSTTAQHTGCFIYPATRAFILLNQLALIPTCSAYKQYTQVSYQDV